MFIFNRAHFKIPPSPQSLYLRISFTYFPRGHFWHSAKYIYPPGDTVKHAVSVKRSFIVNCYELFAIINYLKNAKTKKNKQTNRVVGGGDAKKYLKLFTPLFSPFVSIFVVLRDELN